MPVKSSAELHDSIVILHVSISDSGTYECKGTYDEEGGMFSANSELLVGS